MKMRIPRFGGWFTFFSSVHSQRRLTYKIWFPELLQRADALFVSIWWLVILG
jgi:hypothetical protein